MCTPPHVDTPSSNHSHSPTVPHGLQTQCSPCQPPLIRSRTSLPKLRLSNAVTTPLFSPYHAPSPSQDIRATNIIVSMLSFHLNLTKRSIPATLVHLKPSFTDNTLFLYLLATLPGKIASYLARLCGVVPVCMDQYNHMMASNRMPRLARYDVRHTTYDIRLKTINNDII